MIVRLLPFFALLLALLPVRSSEAADVLPQYESSTVTVDQPNGQMWHTVTFVHSFVAPPVVITGPATKNDLAPMTIRLRNVTATGFEYQMDEWDYLDGTHGKESFSYLAVPTGIFQIGGVTWQAGRVSSVQQPDQPVAFATAFAKMPVVLAQVETANNPQALMARVSAVLPTQFNLRIQAQQAETATLLGESVGYLAATPGTAVLDGVSFAVGRTTYAVYAAWHTLTYGPLCPSAHFFAQAQTTINAAPVVLRQRLINAKNVELCFQGEASTGVTKFVSGELIGFLSMGETQGMLGKNARHFAVLPPDCPGLDAAGRLLDRWGKPYFLHPLSREILEIRSAGPDGKFGTADDVQIGDEAGSEIRR